jgi:putative hydrolase
VESQPLTPPQALERIALLLQVSGEPSFRGRVFREAARTLRALPEGELETLAAEDRLRELAGVGSSVERAIREALAGQRPAYLRRLEHQLDESLTPTARELLEALRGDCHMHSNWSDGRVSIEAMATAARELGHDYAVLTDHSPRLTVAKGLSAERLRDQLEVVGALNRLMTRFRLLSGIEVDVLDGGELDQEEELLAGLDLVVGSAHSKLRMEADGMTRRLLNALANPNLDVLGHCTGRIVTGRRGRPESTFDEVAVVEACARYDKALEINCRPERLDPPRRILRMAVEAGCKFSINTDAHTPEELGWQLLGCDRAAQCGIEPEQVVNTWPVDKLLAWTAGHRTG